MVKKRKGNKKMQFQSVQSIEQVELDVWLEEATRKYDAVLRRLADTDPEMLVRVRANMERYRSTFERLADS